MQMENRYAKIHRFLSATEELMTGSYQNAESRISEILKAIAGSNEIKELLEVATYGFDYPAAKRACLKAPTVGSARGSAYLPADRKEILAFVFCLMVELDAGNIAFGDFLLRYFYKDGSYTASFSAFSERMIRPFHDIILECFPEDAAKKAELEFLSRQSEETVARIFDFLNNEEAVLAGSVIGEEDRAHARVIAEEIVSAANKRDLSALKALLHGYRYFLLYLGAIDRVPALTAIIEEL